MLAGWNGQPATGKGGTADVVAYAQQVGRPVLHINTVEHTIKLIGPKEKTEMIHLEEYTLFVEDTARFSERRQTITNTYITINGAIAGLITFLIKDSGLTDWWLVVAILPLTIFGGAICYYWQQLIRKYKMLVGLRLKVLREMEAQLPGSVQMYHREDELYPRNMQGNTIPKRGLNFSDLEVRLPQLFIALYALLELSLLVGTWLVLTHVLPAPIMPQAKP